MSSKNTFEPLIVAFCCEWCSYAAADLAGSMRLQYPPNVRIIKVPCTGRIDIIHLLRSLEKGADGVFISGCLIGECHFMNGNVRATKRVAHAKEILKKIGIEPERIEIYYNSASMGIQFAQTCTDFTEKIRNLGPIFKALRKSK